MRAIAPSGHSYTLEVKKLLALFSGILKGINTKTLEEIIEDFKSKGGRINSYYLKNPKKSPTLVFYKRWFRGRNIREAIARALAR